MVGATIAQLGVCQTLRFNPHPGHSVVSSSKTLHPHCLVPVQPRKPSQNDQKIVNLKPQTNKQIQMHVKVYIHVFYGY